MFLFEQKLKNVLIIPLWGQIIKIFLFFDQWLKTSFEVVAIGVSVGDLQ